MRSNGQRAYDLVIPVTMSHRYYWHRSSRVRDWMRSHCSPMGFGGPGALADVAADPLGVWACGPAMARPASMTTLLPGGDGSQLGQAVDRRFNRRRYDTAKTIDAFGVRLRDQVDLDTLSGELLAVVDQTMEPTRRPCGSDPRPSSAEAQHRPAQPPDSRPGTSLFAGVAVGTAVGTHRIRCSVD